MPSLITPEESHCNLFNSKSFYCFSKLKRLIRWRLLLLTKWWHQVLFVSVVVSAFVWLLSCLISLLTSPFQMKKLHSHTLQNLVFQSVRSYAPTNVCLRVEFLPLLCRGANDLISVQMVTHWHFSSTSIYHPLGNNFLHRSCNECIASPLSTCLFQLWYTLTLQNTQCHTLQLSFMRILVAVLPLLLLLRPLISFSFLVPG